MPSETPPPERLPVVLSHDEIKRVLCAILQGPCRIMDRGKWNQNKLSCGVSTYVARPARTPFSWVTMVTKPADFSLTFIFIAPILPRRLTNARKNRRQIYQLAMEKWAGKK